MKLKVALTIFGLVSGWSWGYYIPSVLIQPATVIFSSSFFYFLVSQVSTTHSLNSRGEPVYFLVALKHFLTFEFPGGVISDMI